MKPTTIENLHDTTLAIAQLMLIRFTFDPLTVPESEANNPDVALARVITRFQADMADFLRRHPRPAPQQQPQEHRGSRA